jgi:hypothetical protein
VWVDRNEPKADIINDTKALLSSSPAQKGLKNCCEKHSLQLIPTAVISDSHGIPKSDLI